MSLVFYYIPMSTADVTNGVLAELAIPFERVTLNLQAGGTRTPEFLAVNPNGRVPAIIHDGTSIWESAAITLYLGEVFGMDAGLYPAPGPRRGEAMKWIVWGNVALAAAAGRFSASLPAGGAGGVEVGSRDFVAEEARGGGEGDTAKADLEACLRILDGGLADRSFLADDYTLADTHVAGFVGWIGMMGVDLQRHPNVAAWLRRCGQRPALAWLSGN